MDAEQIASQFQPHTYTDKEKQHMASIIYSTVDKQGRYLPLGRRINIIGRSEALSMQVLDDQVSRKHLKIRYEESTGQHLASDMNSHNGVSINGKKIGEETALKEGDLVRVGTTDLLFTETDFDDEQSALHHYKKVGERAKPTMME